MNEIESANAVECAALVVGVSEYTRDVSLPACEKDASTMRRAIIKNLYVDSRNIECLCGYVTRDAFEKAFNRLLDAHPKFGIIYFSGHGSQNGITCNLRFSDKACVSNYVVDEARKRIPRLLIILDCCYAGMLEVELDDSSVLSSDVGDGCHLFLASRDKEQANSAVDSDTSLFTNRFAIALRAGYSRARGVIDFSTVAMSLRRMMDVWNEAASESDKQHVVIRSSGYTSLQVHNPHHASCPKKSFNPIVGDGFIIKSIEPKHVLSYKRYAMKILVPDTNSDEVLLDVVERVIPYALRADLYKSEQQGIIWKGKQVTHVFMHFYTSELDYELANPEVSINWVDPYANREVFYKGNGRVIGDVYFERNASHQSVSRLIVDNLMTQEKAIAAIVQHAERLVGVGRELFSSFGEYQNGSFPEADFISRVADIQSRYKLISRDIQNIGFAVGECGKAIDLLIDIDGAIYDGVLYYTHNHYLSRDIQSRVACMNSAMSRFYRTVARFIEEVKDVNVDFSSYLH